VISELDEDNNIVRGGPITVKLALSPTTVSVQSSPAAPVYGQRLTLTLTVTATEPQAGAPAPTGTVQVFDNGFALPGSPVSLGSGGVAVLQVENLGAGPHSLTARYTPDAAGASRYLASPDSSPAVVTVNKASTSTTLTASSNPSLLAKAVTLTALVAAVAPGAGLPTGTVTFKDGATTLGTVALANVGGTATATFTTSSLSAGSHPITATYGGEANFLPSTSAPLTQVVSYVFSGFQTPLTTAGTFQSPTFSGSWSFSRVLPIKWQLTNGNGANITDLSSANPLSATFAGATCPGTPNGTTVLLYSPTAGAAGGSTFRSGSSGFIFNWDATKNATRGCWWIRLKLSDGSPEKVTTALLQ
jgi:hypothetical protein